MNANVHRQLNRRKRRILRRIENQPGVERHQPMMTASNIHYEIADRTRAIAPGGIGAIHLMARKIGLVDAIDRDLHLLERHMRYPKSDHVLNIAYNLLTGGGRLEHLEIRRKDEVYLDALDARRIAVHSPKETLVQHQRCCDQLRGAVTVRGYLGRSGRRARRFRPPGGA